MKLRFPHWLKLSKGYYSGRNLIVPVIVALIAAADAVLAVNSLAFLKNTDNVLSDWVIGSLTPAEPQDPDIVIVTITNDTLQQFPYRSPIDRQFISELLKTIEARKPRAIGLDVLFDQPTEPQKDEMLRKTLVSLKVPIVVGYTDSPVIVTDQQKVFLDDFVPPKFRALVTLTQDQFEIVRWTSSGAEASDGSYLPGFAHALAASAGVDPPRGLVTISWHGQPAPNVSPFAEYPAHLVGQLPVEWFKDKIVLIGADIEATDRHRTPLSSVFAGSLPGITIQAHSLAQLLHGKRPAEIGLWSNLLLAFGWGLSGAGLGLVNRPLALRAGAGLLLLATLWGGGAMIFHYGGPIIGLVAPTISLAFSFWVMEALTGREVRRQREFVRDTFSHYVSPKVVDQLLREPTRVSVESERRVMSYIFTDITDFTALAESMETTELARVLNAYLDGMTEMVHKHDGIVDKFIGDGVFAIFNAPIEQADHAERAVRCALDIDIFAERFRAEQTAKNIPFGITRIGVNTGSAAVGNFGSSARFEYTAQGDAVNVAARLEGLNKYLGTRICVSDSTRSLCRTLTFRPIASVVLKGKTTPVDIWEPVHQPETCAEFLARYGHAYAHVKAQSPDALELFSALHIEDPKDPCVAFHLERLRQGALGTAIVMREK